MGRNDQGQLGLGDSEDRGNQPGEMGDALPTLDLGSYRTAVSLVAGGVHTCGLLDDGTVKCWGGNSGGNLGLGDTQKYGVAALVPAGGTILVCCASGSLKLGTLSAQTTSRSTMCEYGPLSPRRPTAGVFSSSVSTISALGASA